MSLTNKLDQIIKNQERIIALLEKSVVKNTFTIENIGQKLSPEEVRDLALKQIHDQHRTKLGKLEKTTTENINY